MTLNRFSKKSPDLIYKTIHFKSKLEVDCFKMFETEGIDLAYEPTSFQLIPKLKLNHLLIYLPSRKTKTKKVPFLKEFSGILHKAEYTPDFIYVKDNTTIFIETKGKANDAYPMRRKLFFHYLEQLADTEERKYIFIEPHNKSQIAEAIEIVKNL